jgi:hypothetical protein
MFSFVWSGGLMAWALAMERDQDWKKLLQFQPGVFVNREIGERLRKKQTIQRTGTKGRCWAP